MKFPPKLLFIPKSACKYLQLEITRQNEEEREKSGRDLGIVIVH